MHRGASLCLLGLLALGGQACGSVDEREHLGRLRFETEHFRYYALDGEATCENTGYWLERSYSSLSNYLELPTARSKKIDYEWVTLDRGDWVRQACNAKAGGGCALGDERIVSTRAFDPHEITHIIAARYGDGGSFFAEGLAGMLYCGHPQIYEPLDKRLLDPSLLTVDIGSLGDSGSVVARVVARSLVYYLTHHFEKRKFFQFYASLEFGADLATVESRFFEAYEVPLADVIADWQAIPERQDEACQYLIECEGEPATGAVAFQTACGMEVRPTDSDTFVSFEVGASGRVLIDDDNTSAALGMLGVYACDGGAAGLASLGGSQTRYLVTRPGRHFVWIRADEDIARGTLTFSEPLPGTDSCSLTGAPIALLPDRLLMVSRRWQPGTCSGFPWCPGENISFVAAENGTLGVNPLWGNELSITSPKSVYRCDTACPSNPATSCRSDVLVFGSHPGDVFNVLRSPVHAGEVVHVAAGPINSDDDAFLIGYSL